MEEKFWHRSYVSNVKGSLNYQKLTISQALTKSALQLPGNIALNYMGKKIIYRELEDRVNQFAKVLIDLGINHRDKVAVCLPSIPQVIISNLAILRIGAVTVQVNPLSSERELEYQLNDSDAKLVITLTLLVPRLQKIKFNTQVNAIIGCHINTYLPFPKKQLFPIIRKDMYRKVEPSDNALVFKDLINQFGPESVDENSKWDELAAILYTGGTTGIGKGVMLSHANLSCNVQQFIAWFPDLKLGEERLVGNFPVFHIAGFMAIQNLIIWQGWENIMVPRPEPGINIEIIKKYKPTFLPGVPTIFVGLLAHPKFEKLDLSCLKGFFSGAAPLASETIRDLKTLSGRTMCEVYGLTESSPVVTITPWQGTIKPGTVGIPVPDTEVKIVDAENKEKELAIGEIGEIVVKGPQIMMGYYKKPKETAEVLIDGWLYTGDIGRFDHDGYLTIVDRKKDVIIASGYNIYPVEIDEVLFEHPEIMEACAIGVPDEYRGETVKAFIVVQDGETLTEEEVITYCREKLAAYKVPKIIEFMDELPKSAVGKILRRELREMESKRDKKSE